MKNHLHRVIFCFLFLYSAPVIGMVVSAPDSLIHRGDADSRDKLMRSTDSTNHHNYASPANEEQPLAKITDNLTRLENKLDITCRAIEVTLREFGVSFREAVHRMEKPATPNCAAPGITISMNQSPQFSATQAATQDTKAQVESNNTAESTATNTTEVKTEVTTVQINQQSQSFMAQVYGHADTAEKYVSNYKKEIFFVVGATGYITVFAYLFMQNIYLKRSDLWSNWKQEISYEELCDMPQKKLTEQLLHDIQEKYINPKNPVNFVQPLTQFVNDVESEMSYIKKYISLATWLSRLYLSSIFPITQNMIEVAQARLDRLLFVRHIFNAWAAEYKIEMAQNSYAKNSKNKHN